MLRGTAKETRQVEHTRLPDDGSIEARYERAEKLGEGSFGTVYRVRCRENNLFYAMKTIQKKHGSRSKASFLDNEVKLLTEVNHPNLIQLHQVLESAQNLYLVIELCEGGELGGYVKKNGPLPEGTVKKIMAKLIDALYYLHKMDIVHRDLKLENILLKRTPKTKNDDFDIRVTDFGLSSKKSITSTDSLFHDHCGTPLYMAPEILESRDYGALCDVWSMGIIMFYLICGHHPFVADDENRLLEVIRSKKLRFDSEKFRNVSKEGLEFLRGMIVYETPHRRTMGELINHPWLTGESSRAPHDDIITMMKQFVVEDEEKHRSTEEETKAPIEPIPKDETKKSYSNLKKTPSKSTLLLAENRSQRRLSSNLQESSSLSNLKMRTNPTIRESTTVARAPNRFRLARSQSQSLVPVSSRNPKPNDRLELPSAEFCTPNETKKENSSTNTALLLINRKFGSTVANGNFDKSRVDFV